VADPTSSSATPSATPLGHHGGSHHAHHGATSSPSSPSVTDSAAGTPQTDPVEPTDSGLPGWVAPGLVALVFAAAAVVIVVRRKGTGGS
ncbi:MAG: hypothetical protein QOH37_2151, partial [Nocardioidaceae bacterium]|nr:hypothetical protein [Nocardioidaceae bacterium]